MFATSAGLTDGTIVQRLNPRAAAYLTTSVVLPPDSEVVAPVSVRSAYGIRPGP